jgi:hypothetical protein
MTSGPGAGEQAVSVGSSDLSVSGLRSRLDALAAELGAPGEPGYLDAAKRVVESAVELVGAEEVAQDRRRAKRRWLNKFRCIVTNVWLGLECISLGVGVVLGTYSTFWLLLLVPLFLCAMAIGIMVRDPKLEFGYTSFWPGTFLAAATYGSLELVINHLIPGGFTALVVLLAVCMFGTFQPVTFTQVENEGSDTEVHDAIPEPREGAEPSDAPVAGGADRVGAGGSGSAGHGGVGSGGSEGSRPHPCARQGVQAGGGRSARCAGRGRACRCALRKPREAGRALR